MSLELESNRSLFNEKRRSLSSPTSTQRTIERLPKIEHPAKKFQSLDQRSLDVRGKSSDGRTDSHQGELIRNEFADEYPNRSRGQRRRRSSSFRNSNRNDENVRLPIFGSFFSSLLLFSVPSFPLCRISPVEHRLVAARRPIARKRHASHLSSRSRRIGNDFERETPFSVHRCEDEVSSRIGDERGERAHRSACAPTSDRVHLRHSTSSVAPTDRSPPGTIQPEKPKQNLLRRVRRRCLSQRRRFRLRRPIVPANLLETRTRSIVVEENLRPNVSHPQRKTSHQVRPLLLLSFSSSIDRSISEMTIWPNCVRRSPAARHRESSKHNFTIPSWRWAIG